MKTKRYFHVTMVGMKWNRHRTGMLEETRRPACKDRATKAGSLDAKFHPICRACRAKVGA